MSVCPPEAIHEDIEIPGHLQHFIAINREFFEPLVSGLSSPGGADGMASKQIDHPLVKATLRAVGQECGEPGWQTLDRAGSGPEAGPIHVRLMQKPDFWLN